MSEQSVETISVIESHSEVVDLTCEATDTSVVDLTNNDSVVEVLDDVGTQSSCVLRAESYVLSSDDEEEPSLNPVLLTSLSANAQARAMPGTVSCPVCLDSYSEIIESGRLMVSTKCGHLFCSQCIRDSLAQAHNCPTCRKKLTQKQYHPIYI